jgi:hypothetical protein
VSGPIFIEAIESRLLMSAAPTLFDATVKADRLVVRADLLKFRIDLLTADAKLSADLQAVKHSVPTGDTSLVGPFATLHAEVKAMSLTLQEDRLTESANALSAEATVKLDLVQILKDKHNATAEAADHAKLLTDRVAVQTALINGLDARIATRTADEATISADTAAIVTAASSDPAATVAMQAAVSTFATDRVAKLNQLTADLQTLETARTNLSDALTAAQST